MNFPRRDRPNNDDIDDALNTLMNGGSYHLIDDRTAQILDTHPNGDVRRSLRSGRTGPRCRYLESCAALYGAVIIERIA